MSGRDRLARMDATERRVLLAELLRQRGKTCVEGADLPPLAPSPADRHRPFPLNDIQQAYWIGRQGLFEIGNVAAHLYLEIDARDLDVDRLERAWRCLVDRHDMLRARVLPDARQQVQATVPPYRVAVEDLRALPPAARVEALADRRGLRSHQLLPVESWPPFEIAVARLGDRVSRVFFSIDSIATDAGSLLVLFREWARLYGEPSAQLPPLELSFRDYVLAEEAFRRTALYAQSLAYWRRRVADLPAAPALPLAVEPRSVDRPRFVRRRAVLAPATWRRLKAVAGERGLTPSGLLLAAYAEVLAAWSVTSRFSLNVTLFNRLPLHPQVGALVGDFTSMLFIDLDRAAEGCFGARALALQRQLGEALNHRWISGVRVLRELVHAQGGDPTRARMPVVFTSLVGLADPGESRFPLAALGEIRHFITQTPQVWLDNQVYEAAGSLVANFDAVEQLLPAPLLDEMFTAYRRLLRRLAQGAGAWSDPAASLLPPAQLARRRAANATSAPIPAGLAHCALARHAATRSTAPAIVAADRALSWAELYSLSNRVGRHLRQRGSRPDTLVAVVMEKGWEQVAAVAGILASGAAYLPVDPDLPAARLQWTLLRGEAAVALTTRPLAGALPWPPGVTPLCLDDPAIEATSDAPLASVQEPTHLAYVLNTSGSTGEPKGVMIEHRSVVNRVADVARRFAVGPADRLFGLTALVHDLSVWDLFGSFATGATLVLPAAGRERDPQHWLERIGSLGVTVWNSVPAFGQMLAEFGDGRPEGAAAAIERSTLRLALLSGDRIPLSLPDRLRGRFPGVAVVSLGGPTETTVWDICYPVGEVDPKWRNIPYGRPMVNATYRVRSPAGEERPDGVAGELVIGGVGLARGYWRDEARTREKFYRDSSGGERLYRSGDLGRWRPDGTLEILGRTDHQVKIRGLRIEPGEIEHALELHPAVRRAVVGTVDGPGGKRLAAWVVPRWPAGAGGGALLTDPEERRLLQRARLAHRRSGPGQSRLPLVADLAALAPFAARASARAFAGAEVSGADLARLLASLANRAAGGAGPRHLYASAGGLYPVQLYLHARPQRIAGVAAGWHYLDPDEPVLVHLRGDPEPPAGLHFPVNARLAAGAAFTLALVAERRAIAPLYGERSRDFCLIEAGLMAQLLEMAAAGTPVGLRQIGYANFAALAGPLGLGETQEVLHLLVGGVRDDGAAGAPEEPPVAPRPGAAAREIAATSPGAPRRLAAGADAGMTAAELVDHLRARLPAPMVPAAFLFLDRLPSTPNGKLDRAALPAPGEDATAPTDSAPAAPDGELEALITAVWREILGRQRVGRDQGFFELGGDSLLLVRAHAELERRLGRSFSFLEMFSHPTVRALGARLALPGSHGGKR